MSSSNIVVFLILKNKKKIFKKKRQKFLTNPILIVIIVFGKYFLLNEFRRRWGRPLFPTKKSKRFKTESSISVRDLATHCS
jgi:hypothetical protein